MWPLSTLKSCEPPKVSIALKPCNFMAMQGGPWSIKKKYSFYLILPSIFYCKWGWVASKCLKMLWATKGQYCSKPFYRDRKLSTGPLEIHKWLVPQLRVKSYKCSVIQIFIFCIFFIVCVCQCPRNSMDYWPTTYLRGGVKKFRIFTSNGCNSLPWCCSSNLIVCGSIKI